MKTTLGGDRLGSGKKQEISMRNYERSTHDLSYIWRSTMSVGTLVPFMSTVALPGDKMDIDLQCEVLTLPTIGPLFGSAKVQLDVFKVPIRLYQAKLHMNMLNIGMEMDKILLPQIGVGAPSRTTMESNYKDRFEVNTSCLLRYLGISGVGTRVAGTDTSSPIVKNRYFNAIPLLAYWDIFKQYYSNKQEEDAFVIHTSEESLDEFMTPIEAYFVSGAGQRSYIFEQENTIDVRYGYRLILEYPKTATKPNHEFITIKRGGVDVLATELFQNYRWKPIGEGEGRRDREKNLLIFTDLLGTAQSNTTYEYNPTATPVDNPNDIPISLTKFPLKDIDDMRMRVLSEIYAVAPLRIDEWDIKPYSFLKEWWGDETKGVKLSIHGSQEGLALKTYNSDLFNNWIDTEWIDGDNGINAITAIDTTGDSFTLDAFNLASKVYVMLNRIAISGGTYDDWLEAVYTNERKKSTENPVYLGGLIRELVFEEVVSNADTSEQPLGTLAGRGKLTGKNKGGKITVDVDEPSYIMGIVSITPRIDYSQGNKWDMNLRTMDDFHKPALDGIGFQDLITDQMHFSDTGWNAQIETAQYHSAGKQPAWINYMTEVNRCYGNFAEPEKEMFMTFNRRYETNPLDGDSLNGRIKDLTTYIDPTKYNNIFAETKLDAQNYWVQIGVNNIARRKMSAKIIPNL